MSTENAQKKNVIVRKHKRGIVRFDPKNDKTDQSKKNACDNNYIIAQYKKTGLMPEVKNKIAQYLDHTKTPDFITAHKIVSEARELFLALPAEVRKRLDNNPANMESFFKDPENIQFLLKHRILEEKKVPEKEPLLTPKDAELLRSVLKSEDKPSK